jgi:CRISPR/Cas system-associated exonuclease Cas4 (RecB family)
VSTEAKPINWSFSKLTKYETCAFRFKLQYIDRIPEPERPPDNPMERGNRIHNNLEAYVKGTETLEKNESKKLDVFVPALENLQLLYANGQATAEDNWFFDKDWFECERSDVWLWSKLDFLVFDKDTGTLIVGDYKSGKSMYKAIEHIQQTQLYAACATLKYPDFDFIRTELWYVDEGHVKAINYNKDRALKFVDHFDQRVQKLYNDKYYRPNPTKQTCRYCPYGPRELGVCPVGV